MMQAHRQVSLVLSLVRRDIVECDLETVLNEQDPFVFESVKNVIEEYKGLFEEAFLLLNISKTGKYVYNIEKAARDGQLENYYSLYLNGKETDTYPAMNAEIQTCGEIESNTRHFMKYIATRAKLATIVVNGHGTPSGEILLEDDSKYLSSKFLKDVHKIWEELHKEEVVDKDNVILPAKVTVVFAQCYGHRYEQDPEHEHAIRVVSLSTDKTPETTYTIKRCGHDFIDSKHEELNEYAIRNKTGTSPEQNPDSLPKSLGAETMQATVDDRLGCEFFVPSLFATISLTRSYSINFNELLKQIVNGWRKGKKEAYKNTSCHSIRDRLNLLTLNNTNATK